MPSPQPFSAAEALSPDSNPLLYAVCALSWRTLVTLGSGWVVDACCRLCALAVFYGGVKPRLFMPLLSRSSPRAALFSTAQRCRCERAIKKSFVAGGTFGLKLFSWPFDFFADCCCWSSVPCPLSAFLYFGEGALACSTVVQYYNNSTSTSFISFVVRTRGPIFWEEVSTVIRFCTVLIVPVAVCTLVS